MSDDEPLIYSYQVGGMFNPERDRWPDGPHLWMDEESDVRLAVFLTRPSRPEREAIESGTPRFGWVQDGMNGFLLYKYGDAPWADVIFNPQRMTDPFDMQPMPRGTHRRVFSFLVHADTGTIAAMRMFTWPAYFLNTVIESVRRLEAAPYGEPEARAQQQDFYRRYPNGAAVGRLVKTLPMEARCQGGQRDDRPY